MVATNARIHEIADWLTGSEAPDPGDPVGAAMLDAVGEPLARQVEISRLATQPQLASTLALSLLQAERRPTSDIDRAVGLLVVGLNGSSRASSAAIGRLATIISAGGGDGKAVYAALRDDEPGLAKLRSELFKILSARWRPASADDVADWLETFEPVLYGAFPEQGLQILSAGAGVLLKTGQLNVLGLTKKMEACFEHLIDAGMTDVDAETLMDDIGRIAVLEQRATIVIVRALRGMLPSESERREITSFVSNHPDEAKGLLAEDVTSVLRGHATSVGRNWLALSAMLMGVADWSAATAVRAWGMVEKFAPEHSLIDEIYRLASNLRSPSISTSPEYWYLHCRLAMLCGDERRELESLEHLVLALPKRAPIDTIRAASRRLESLYGQVASEYRTIAGMSPEFDVTETAQRVAPLVNIWLSARFWERAATLRESLGEQASVAVLAARMKWFRELPNAEISTVRKNLAEAFASVSLAGLKLFLLAAGFNAVKSCPIINDAVAAEIGNRMDSDESDLLIAMQLCQAQSEPSRQLFNTKTVTGGILRRAAKNPGAMARLLEPYRGEPGRVRRLLPGLVRMSNTHSWSLMSLDDWQAWFAIFPGRIHGEVDVDSRTAMKKAALTSLGPLAGNTEQFIRDQVEAIP